MTKSLPYLGFLLSALGVCAWAGGSEAAEQPLPVIGAIRWDGWFQDNPWERNLVSEQWRYRLPFYATTADNGAGHICGDSQETMDREIADAIKQAFAWIRINPKAAPARTVLVYAWNEHDEGGWLCPTIQEGSARLNCVRKMLDAYVRSDTAE